MLASQEDTEKKKFDRRDSISAIGLTGLFGILGLINIPSGKGDSGSLPYIQHAPLHEGDFDPINEFEHDVDFKSNSILFDQAEIFSLLVGSDERFIVEPRSDNTRGYFMVRPKGTPVGVGRCAFTFSIVTGTDWQSFLFSGATNLINLRSNAGGAASPIDIQYQFQSTAFYRAYYNGGSIYHDFKSYPLHNTVLGTDMDVNSQYLDNWVTAATCTLANVGYFKIKIGGTIKRVPYYDDA